MVNGAFNLLSNARYFGLQRGDPRPEVFDGKRIEILAAERDEGIVDAAGQEIVRFHDAER